MSGLPDVVDDPSDSVVKVAGSITHRCPHRNEVDEGRVELAWVCRGATFELHSLRGYVDTWAPVEISHEALVARIAHDLATADPRVELVTARATFTTAEFTVEVESAVPGDAIQPAGP